MIIVFHGKYELPEIEIKTVQHRAGDSSIDPSKITGMLDKVSSI